MKNYVVYILTNKINTVLYTGLTDNLSRRLEQHRAGTAEGFTKKYKTNKLIHAEMFENIIEAQNRERQIKKWNRQWKIDLIEQNNAAFRDLSEELF